MEKSESIKELAAALNLFQSEVRNALKTSANPFFKSSYANLEEIIETSREPLKKNNLSVSQFPFNDAEFIGIETVLMHNSGEYIASKISVKNVKGDIQSAGSILTYLRRYSLAAVLKIAQADDDGNSATPNIAANPVTPTTKLEDTLFNFGKFKNKSFKEVGEKELTSYYDFLEKSSRGSGKPMPDIAKKIGEYLDRAGV